MQYDARVAAEQSLKQVKRTLRAEKAARKRLEGEVAMLRGLLADVGVDAPDADDEAEKVEGGAGDE